MEQPREYGTKKDTRSSREWVVEYEVDIGEGVINQHLTVLSGWNVQDVQASLFNELRDLYPHSERLDVTITRLEPVSTSTDIRRMDLTGMFRP